MVGGLLVQALLEAPDFARVFALTRRPLGREHPKLANRIVIFERMAEQLKGLAAHDAFCCLGTTIAEAGSQEAFREVDVDAVLLFAQAARAAGANRFVVLSSVGASTSLQEVLPAHQGGDGRRRHDAGIPLGRHPAAESLVRSTQACAAAGDARGTVRAANQSAADRFARSLARHSGRDWSQRQWSARLVVARAASTATPMVQSASSPTSNPCSRYRHNPAKKTPRLRSAPWHS